MNVCPSAPLRTHNNPALSARFWCAPKLSKGQNLKKNNENRVFYCKKVVRKALPLDVAFICWITYGMEVLRL